MQVATVIVSVAVLCLCVYVCVDTYRGVLRNEKARQHFLDAIGRGKRKD